MACRQNRALSFLAGKCQKTCKGMPGRGGGVIYPRGCRDEEPSLTIASSLASTVRGCGEGAAHDSGRHGVAIRGAWRRPGSQERQAGGYGVEFWPLVAGAACRQDHERVSGESLPFVVAGCSRWRQDSAGHIPPMSVCPGEVFDAGGGPSCDMNADAERGVVPMMTGISCILSSSRPDAMPTTSRPPVGRIADGSARFVHDGADAAGCFGSARRGRHSARGKNGF